MSSDLGQTDSLKGAKCEEDFGSSVTVVQDIIITSIILDYIGMTPTTVNTKAVR